MNSKVDNAVKTVGCEKHREIERKISSEAITVFRNSDKKLPFNKLNSEKILFITPYQNEISSSKFAINRLIKERKTSPNISTDYYCFNKQYAINNELKSKINKADYIIMFTEKYNVSLINWTIDFPRNVIKYVHEIGRPESLTVVNIGQPYDIINFKNANHVLLAYGCVGADPTDADNGIITKKFGPNIPAAIEACLGLTSPNGILPIELPQ